MTRKYAASCLFALLCVGLAACGGGSGGSSADTNALLEKYPTWDEFAAVEDPVNEQVDVTNDFSSGSSLCTTTSYFLSENPEEIVTFGTAPDVLYLGSLIQGDSYLSGLGSMEELPIRQRAPLTIAIKVLTGTDLTREVEDPDAASVQQALSDIVAEAEDSGYETGGNAYYVYKESYSSEQMALSLGISYRCLGASAKTTMSYETSEEKNTISAYFKQVLFEAYIVRPQTPADFFSAEFTQEHLDEQIDLGNMRPDNLPVYVSRIQYGRILLYSMTSTASMEKLKLAAKAGYEGFGSFSVDTKSELQNIIDESEIKVVAIGGGDTSLKECLITGDIAAYFKSDVSLTSAEPIAYAVVNLADGTLARVSEATDYNSRQCSSASAKYYSTRTEWEMAVAEMCGDALTKTFQTTADNIALSNEVAGPPAPNDGLGQILTWERAATDYPFDFHLNGTHSGGTGLVYMDMEGGPAFGSMDQERSISIGDVDNNENDNFEIKITDWDHNCAVFAIGIEVGDNQAAAEENITVTGTNNFEKIFSETSPHCPGTHGFIGIVSTVPLISVFFNEGNGSDDIFVRDPSFAYLQWTE